MNIQSKEKMKEDSQPTSKKRTILSGVSPAMRLSLLTCLLIALVFCTIQLVLLFKPYGFGWLLTAGLVILAAGVIGAAVLTLILAVLRRLRWQTALVFFFSFLICITSTYLELYLIPLMIFSMAAVYFIYMCAKGHYKALSRPRRLLRYGLTGFFGVLTAAVLALILWPGPALKIGDRPDKAVLALPYAENVDSAAAAIDDPSIQGNYSYSVYFYASPDQKLNPYPGQEIIAAGNVDASKLVEGWSVLRQGQLGFGADTLPLNAQVWMPEGAGPFPLVLIVHGNHELGDRSDDGYAYLGELLASHGMIAASVDENFLNNSVLYDLLLFAGLKEENDARAFVLLEHLQQWYEWNDDTSSVFFGKVDFDRLALIGHSRGGEAAAVAAAFAQLEYYPDNGILKFDYPFQINTVVAIAPVHGMYAPAEVELSLENTNYLVLHGGLDMDVSSFMGSNMYHRTDVSARGIKAQVWMQHANHGQFNSSWGNSDSIGLANLMYNRKLLMPMEEQQQAAKVFIGAFLEAALSGKTEYTELFKNFAHGEQWLPPTIYITDYIDSGMLVLDSYDSSYDLRTSSSGLVSYTAQGFDKWTESELPGKGGNSNRVLTLFWGRENDAENTAQPPSFKAEFAQGILSAGDKLYISLCSGKKSAEGEEVSFQIKLIDSNGNAAVMNIDDFGGVVNPIGTPIAKLPISRILGTSEPVLQAVCIPLERFAGLSGDIVSMEWVFDNAAVSKNGQIIYVDDLRVEK